MLPTKNLPNCCTSTSKTVAYGSQIAQFPVYKPIEITLAVIGSANRGTHYCKSGDFRAYFACVTVVEK